MVGSYLVLGPFSYVEFIMYNVIPGNETERNYSFLLYFLCLIIIIFETIILGSFTI